MNIGLLLLQRGAGRANRGGSFAGRPAGGSERPKGGGKGRQPWSWERIIVFLQRLPPS
jgi:hypothetical protein